MLDCGNAGKGFFKIFKVKHQIAFFSEVYFAFDFSGQKAKGFCACLVSPPDKGGFFLEGFEEDIGRGSVVAAPFAFQENYSVFGLVYSEDVDFLGFVPPEACTLELGEEDGEKVFFCQEFELFGKIHSHSFGLGKNLTFSLSIASLFEETKLNQKSKI